GESGSERKPARAAFKIGDAFFVSGPGRIDRARIIVALVFARTFLDVGRRQVNRRHDRAGGRVGLLASVNGAGGEVVLLLHCWQTVTERRRFYEYSRSTGAADFGMWRRK